MRERERERDCVARPCVRTFTNCVEESPVFRFAAQHVTPLIPSSLLFFFFSKFFKTRPKLFFHHHPPEAKKEEKESEKMWFGLFLLFTFLLCFVCVVVCLPPLFFVRVSFLSFFLSLFPPPDLSSILVYILAVLLDFSFFRERKRERERREREEKRERGERERERERDATTFIATCLLKKKNTPARSRQTFFS